MRLFWKMIAKVFLISVLVLSVAACGREKSKDECNIVDISNHSRTRWKYSCSEDGAFYLGTDSLLHYISAKTGEDIIFCFEPSCKHEPPSSANKDPECMAAGYVYKTKISYHAGFVYFFVDYVFEHKIYKMDINNGSRELVTELPFSYNIECIVFDGDYVYYMAKDNQEVENSASLIATCDLVEVNLKDGSYRMLTDAGRENGCNLIIFDIIENTIFARMTGSYNYNFYMIDAETLDMELIDGKEESYCGTHDGESYYYICEKEIGIHNVTTGENIVLAEITGNNNETKFMNNLWGSVGKIYYTTYDISTHESEHFFYDVECDKTFNITEKCEELGIWLYDAYKGMFIRNLYGETGEDIVGYSVVDEAEVLGTQ